MFWCLYIFWQHVDNTKDVIFEFDRILFLEQAEKLIYDNLL